jgi:UDPglucose 6-dehydrogenase
MKLIVEQELQVGVGANTEGELQKADNFCSVSDDLMNIGVIGKGFVGSAVFEGLGQLDNIMSFHDPKYDTCIEDIKDTEIVFICVPTDMRDNGTCDTSVVELVLENLTNIKYCGSVAIKSTVIPGTTKKLQKQFQKLNLCCVPEFLRERSALTDFILEHDVLVIGTNDNKISKRVIKAYGNLPKQVRVVSPTEAELCKYFNNVFNALRVTFANGFYDICRNLDADYQKIYDAMIQRNNIDGHYLRASKSMRGFGGYCLPKDTSAFAKLVNQIYGEGNGPRIFGSIVEDNNLYKPTVFKGMRK